MITKNVQETANTFRGVQYKSEDSIIVIDDTDVVHIYPSRFPNMAIIETLDQAAGEWV